MDSNETVCGFPSSSIFKFANQSTIYLTQTRSSDRYCLETPNHWLPNLVDVVKPPGFEAL